MRRILKLVVSRIWRAIGFALTVIGLSGIPGDIDQWGAWVSTLSEHHVVKDVAGGILRFVEYADQPILRIALFLLGLTMLFWPLRFFWRMRHRARLWWRKKVSEEVWVSEEDALEEIRASDWASLKAPHVTETRQLLGIGNFSESALRGFSTQTVSGMSKSEKALARFRMYLEATLRSFHANNPNSVRRNSDDETETNLSALTKYLDEALSGEVEEEFGRVPAISVE